MAIDLVNYLTAGENSPRLWVDFNAYTKKLLLSEDENPWTTPAEYMSFYSQAHGLVKAEVVVLNVWDLLQHWMQDDKEALPSMAGKRRATAAMKAMLEAYGPRELLAEVITALGNNYGDSVPMVMVLPSPRALLAKAHKAANGVDAEPDEMNVDTASMYLADYLRYFSETNLSGVLLEEEAGMLPASGDELGWYQPVFNVAKHYRWSVGIKLPGEAGELAVPGDVDFSIVPAQSPGAGNALGLDITDLLWSGEHLNGSGGKEGGFCYFSIPEEAQPETVLETLSKLKA